MNRENCPKCLGTKELITPLNKRGFKYKTCNYCDKYGTVSKEQAEDYILSINENLLIEE